MAIDFSPSIKPYSNQGAFRFWCQTVLPLVYDDSLSYYELLNKVVNYLNNVISDVSNMGENVTELNNAYVRLQEYVNNYFDNLDVTEEINNKLNEMAADGTLSQLIMGAVDIPETITNWLEEHVQPTSPVVDDTLTISGAAADSKTVGDKLAVIDETITPVPFISKETKNLAPANVVNAEIVSSTGRFAATTLNLEAGTYTISGVVSSNAPGTSCYYAVYKDNVNPDAYPTTDRLAYGTIQKGTSRNSSTFTIAETATRVILCAGSGLSNSAGYTGNWNEVQIENGGVATDFVPPFTAVDYVARENIADVAELLNETETEIYGELNRVETEVNGRVNQLQSDVNNKTTLLDSEVNNQKDTLDSVLVRTKNLTSSDLVDVDITRESGQYWSLNLDLEPGTYTISAIVSSNSPYTGCYYSIYRYSDRPTYFPTDDRLAFGTVQKGTNRNSSTFTITEKATRIILFAGSGISNSAGYTGSWNDVQIESGNVATDFVEPFEIVDEDARNRIDLLENAVSDSLYVTDITNITDTFSVIGVTLQKIDKHTFHLYGTSSKTGYRGISFTGGQNGELYSSYSPEKIYNAGKYQFNIAISGYNTSFPGISYITTTNAQSKVIHNGIMDIDRPFTLSITARGSENFGTESEPTIVSLIVEEITEFEPTVVNPSDGDQTQYIRNVLIQHKVANLISGTYTFVNLRMPKNSTLSGNGDTVVQGSVSDTSMIIMDDYCTVRGLNLRGGLTETPTTLGTAHGISCLSACRGTRIENCEIRGFDGIGINCVGMGMGIYSLYISNVGVLYCYYGMKTTDSEYIMVTGCKFTRNYCGVLNQGGNNKFANCDFSGNVSVNCRIDNAAGKNNGHGSIVGCTFNHAGNDDTDALIISGTGREMIAGCNFHYGKISLLNTNGNVFSGCGFGAAVPIKISGGDCNLFVGCMFRATADTPVTITNNTASKFDSCYLRSGAVFNPVT